MRLKGDQLQAGNLFEVTGVVRGDGIAAFEGAGSNQQIVEGDGDAARGGFRIELSNPFGGVCRNRIHRHSGFQIVQESAAGLAAFGRIGPVDAVCQIGDADCRERGFTFTDLRGYVLQEPGGVQTLALRFNHDAGIEDYSQDGGFHGCPRSPSMVRCSRMGITAVKTVNYIFSVTSIILGIAMILFMLSQSTEWNSGLVIGIVLVINGAVRLWFAQDDQ